MRQARRIPSYASIQTVYDTDGMVCIFLNRLCRQHLISKSFNCVMRMALAPAHSVIDTLRRQEFHNT